MSMTLYQLAGLVGRMRAAQKRYFSTRNATDLDASKKLEREVDRAVKEALEAPSLFDRMNPPVANG